MSFQSDLLSKVREYNQFKVNSYAITIPYSLGAKNVPSDILSKIKTWMNGVGKTKDEIQNWVNANVAQTGVDCSGLVYYVLNEAAGGSVRTFFENQLGLSGKLSYAYGISAANLTNASYGTKKLKAQDIVPGCVIRFDSNGGHVLVVNSVTKDIDGVVDGIHYSHSSGIAHDAYIVINNAQADLNNSSQKWVDSYLSDSSAKSRYQYTLLLTPVAEKLNS